MFPISYSAEPGFKKNPFRKICYSRHAPAGKHATIETEATIEAAHGHAPATKTAKVAPAEAAHAAAAKTAA
jgi:hypothetical protein